MSEPSLIYLPMVRMSYKICPSKGFRCVDHYARRVEGDLLKAVREGSDLIPVVRHKYERSMTRSHLCTTSRWPLAFTVVGQSRSDVPKNLQYLGT